MALLIILIVSNLITAAILCTTCCIQCNAMSYIKKFITDYFSSPYADNSSADKRAPEYLKELQDQEVIEGNEVNFRCKLSGYPQPRVIWYKDGKKLKNSDKYKIGELFNKILNHSLLKAFPKHVRKFRKAENDILPLNNVS